MQPRSENSRGNIRRLVLMSAAAIALSAGAASAQIVEMDYMTEGTADAAVEKALEACTASTGVTVDRQPVPYPELVQKVLLAASTNRCRTSSTSTIPTSRSSPTAATSRRSRMSACQDSKASCRR